jgi:transposase-like protein
MEEYPKTVQEFEEKFASEQSCIDYLFRLRWPEGFRCPRCGYERFWAMNRGLYRCTDCDLQTSITAGTIFQDTRKSLKLWFQAIWYIINQKQGVSALGLQRVLGLGSYRTSWIWLHKLRCAMVRPGRDRLGGVVEVDETYIGGSKPGKRGRGAAGKVLVLVAAQEDENRIGRIRLRRIVDASANSLEEAVPEMVAPGSIVRTDDWSGYHGLVKHGYTHDVVRKDASIGENLLPLANRVIALLKRWLLGTHQGAVQISHLDYYLDEFTFRFNRRTSRSRGKLFYRLVQQAVSIEPVTGNSIIGGVQHNI